MITKTFDEIKWQLVPKEPTKEMYAVGVRERYCNRYNINPYHVYAAMLAAAPAVPAVPSAKDAEPMNDSVLEQALRERDEYHDIADQLADQIAVITDVDIGEHSSANEPWRNALIAADEYLAKNFDPTMYAAFLKGKLAAAEAKRGAK